MIPEAARAALVAVLGERVRFDVPMSRHTSLRVGGPADAHATPEDRRKVRGDFNFEGNSRAQPWKTNLQVLTEVLHHSTQVHLHQLRLSPDELESEGDAFQSVDVSSDLRPDLFIRQSFGSFLWRELQQLQPPLEG